MLDPLHGVKPWPHLLEMMLEIAMFWQSVAELSEVDTQGGVCGGGVRSVYFVHISHVRSAYFTHIVGATLPFLHVLAASGKSVFHHKQDMFSASYKTKFNSKQHIFATDAKKNIEKIFAHSLWNKIILLPVPEIRDKIAAK